MNKKGRVQNINPIENPSLANKYVPTPYQGSENTKTALMNLRLLITALDCSDTSP